MPVDRLRLPHSVAHFGCRSSGMPEAMNAHAGSADSEHFLRPDSMRPLGIIATT